MIQFGMPTLIELPNIEDCAKLCNKLNLQFIELNMCLPQFQVEQMDVNKLCSLSQKYNLFYTVHLDDTNTPCDFNEKIANAYTDTVIETIEIAKRLNIPVLNMHLALGTHFTLPDRKVLLFEEYESEYIKKLILFRNKCEKVIGETDIKICIENTRAFCHHIGEKSLSLLLKSPVFKVTFDTGHDASNNFTQRVVINSHIDKLFHMHLHDTIVNEHRDHLAFGDGELDLLDYINLAEKHNCNVVVEVKTISGLEKSVKWIEQRL